MPPSTASRRRRRARYRRARRGLLPRRRRRDHARREGAGATTRTRVDGRLFAFDQDFEAIGSTFGGLLLSGPNSTGVLRDVLVAVGEAGGDGIAVGNGTLSGHHVTVVHDGPAGPGAVGIHAAPGGEITLDSTVVSGFP